MLILRNMRRTDAYGAAVRLVAFANLEITEHNWETLWHLGSIVPLLKTQCWPADDPGQGELWRAFVKAVYASDTPQLAEQEADTVLENLRVVLWHTLTRTTEVPRNVRPRYEQAAREYECLRRAIEPHESLSGCDFGGALPEAAELDLHAARLLRNEERQRDLQYELAVGDAGYAVARCFLRGRPSAPWPRRRSIASECVRFSDLAKAQREVQRALEPQPGETTSHRPAPAGDEVEDDIPETFERHVRQLLEKSAHLWPLVRRCANHECGRFCVTRISGKRVRQFCESTCRVHANRQKTKAASRQRYGQFRSLVRKLREGGRAKAEVALETASRHLQLTTAERATFHRWIERDDRL